MLAPGLTYTSTTTVAAPLLAMNMGSGDLPVLATPAMIALMENAAMMAVREHLPTGSTTVGGHIDCSHIRPTAIGNTITATATLAKVEGRKLTFHLKAQDEQGLIGQGEHLRFIVDADRFMQKL